MEEDVLSGSQGRAILAQSSLEMGSGSKSIKQMQHMQKQKSSIMMNDGSYANQGMIRDTNLEKPKTKERTVAYVI